MNLLPPETSLRLQLLRFPPIIGVIYIHAYGTTIPHGGQTLGRGDLDTVTNFIRVFISQGVARIAVPLFFLIAGYLFFVQGSLTWQSYAHKLKSRARTLLLPYLIWNLLTLAIFALGQSLSLTQPFFLGQSKPIAAYGFADYFEALVGRGGYPIAYHFWFIRDLMLLALLAPLFVFILRWLALPFFLAVYICWVSSTWPVFAPGAVGILFFGAGAWCAMQGKSLFFLDRYGPLACLACVPIFIADTIWNNAWFNSYLHRSGLIVAIIATLFLTKPMLRYPRLMAGLLSLGSASFFIYAAHEPLLGIVRTLAYKHIPLHGQWTMLLLYLVLPLVVIALLYLLHRLLRRLAPAMLGLACGGR